MTAAEQGTALLRAILDDPDDDTVRLIYADWLEDDGQAERAGFIRVQLAKEGDPDWHGSLCLPESLCKNCRREEKLMRALWHHWVGFVHSPSIVCANFFPFTGEVYPTVTFRRGFVERVRSPLHGWRECGAVIVRQNPVTRVECTDREPQLRNKVLKPLAFHPVWVWPRGEGGLPTDLWDVLNPTHLVEYDSAELAIDALSAALLKTAKEGNP